MSKTFKVHDKAIVLVLNKAEARAIKFRLEQHTGIKKSKVLQVAEEKLNAEISGV